MSAPTPHPRSRLAAASLATALVAAPASAQPPRPLTLGARAQVALDGDHNPLTNELLYLPVSVEGGAALRGWLRLHGRLGLGLISGAETTGSSWEVAAALVGRARRGPWQVGARLEVGYAWSTYAFATDRATTGGILLEPGLEVGVAVGRRGTVVVVAGPRLRAIGSSTPTASDRQWNTGFHVGLGYEHAL
ncbi:MAG: hypothetical protein R3B06_15115 [Kofleriaceae bacterium]